jgi:hypothetical protein
MVWEYLILILCHSVNPVSASSVHSAKNSICLSLVQFTLLKPTFLTLPWSDLCRVFDFPGNATGSKGKGLPQQAEVPQGVQGRLRPRIFLTFGTMRVVGRQPYAPAAFTPGEIPGYSFLEAESTPGHMVLSVATEKIPSDTTGIDSETVRLVAQCLNHYATPRPKCCR